MSKKLREALKDLLETYLRDSSTIFPEEIIAVIQARAALAEPEFCEWTYDDTLDRYDTSCNHAYCFSDGGVSENGQKYCGYCGKPITEVKEVEMKRKGTCKRKEKRSK